MVSRLTRTIIYIVLVVGVLLIIAPIYWMVISSVKPSGEIFSYPPVAIPKELYFGHYVKLFRETYFLRNFLNSVFVASIYTIVSTFVCSLGGYALAKFRFPGRNSLFFIILGSLMIPLPVTLIPLFFLISKLGWMNAYPSVIFPFVASPMGIFMMRQNMLGVPNDLLDAARIDGCSEFAIYYKILLPVVKPALVTYIIIAFLQSWNDFLWPLIALKSEEMLTLPLFINNSRGQYDIDYGRIMSSSTLATLPVIILFAFMARKVIAGALAGSIKE